MCHLKSAGGPVQQPKPELSWQNTQSSVVFHSPGSQDRIRPLWPAGWKQSCCLCCYWINCWYKLTLSLCTHPSVSSPCVIHAFTGNKWTHTNMWVMQNDPVCFPPHFSLFVCLSFYGKCYLKDTKCFKKYAGVIHHGDFLIYIKK